MNPVKRAVAAFNRLAEQVGIPWCPVCGHRVWCPAWLVYDASGGVVHHARHDVDWRLLWLWRARETNPSKEGQ